MDKTLKTDPIIKALPWKQHSHIAYSSCYINTKVTYSKTINGNNETETAVLKMIELAKEKVTNNYK